MNGVSLRALVLSDIHFEQGPIHRPLDEYPEHDIVILAGDIGSHLDEIVDWLARGVHYGDKPVILVGGNHEYYGHEIGVEDSKARWLARGTRVHFGNGTDVFHIGDTKVIACTLWTNFMANGADKQEASKAAARKEMNDYRLIGIRDGGRTRRLDPDDAEYLFMHESAWIENHLRDEHDGPVIVITHFSPGSMDDDYDDGDRLTPSFTSPLHPLIEEYQPSLWVHGHQHRSFDYFVGETRIVANPKGYGPFCGGRLPENKEFIDDLVIEIPYPQPKLSFGV